MGRERLPYSLVTYESGEFSVPRIRAKLSIKPAFPAGYPLGNYVITNIAYKNHAIESPNAQKAKNSRFSLFQIVVFPVLYSLGKSKCDFAALGVGQYEIKKEKMNEAVYWNLYIKTLLKNINGQ